MNTSLFDFPQNNLSWEPAFANTSNPATWTFGPAGRLTIGLLQLLFNASMLLVFVIKPHLRTSFTIYIIFLLTANLTYTLCEYPLEIIRQLYPHWPLSRSACTFYLYQIWIVCPLTMHMHVLITLNRVWAIALPVSYRNRHSKASACGMCGLIVLYIHILAVPLWLRDELYFRVDNSECSLNTHRQPWYSTAVAIVTQVLPILYVVGAYPFLLVKQLQRRKSRETKVVDVLTRNRQSIHISDPQQTAHHLVIVMLHFATIWYRYRDA
ncbi:allatostatin-A receptor-like [Paramacrobiotus metropolitanus]|uniref:allatostatin-A receptor-like n=1 Tax=Paramacrobiotus metropolitanus TaxID=2943436 RepID=UPI0024464934|nr:allatostatin-A receptor-like [Paramacrobiotus metropolitanus]